jgi:hypothetical protein
MYEERAASQLKGSRQRPTLLLGILARTLVLISLRRDATASMLAQQLRVR